MNSGAAWEYEWDEEKNRANFERRQLDFSEVRNFVWDTAITRRSDRFQEPRWLAIGYIGDQLHVVIFTRRNGRYRIISLRKASDKERSEYAQTPTQ